MCVMCAFDWAHCRHQNKATPASQSQTFPSIFTSDCDGFHIEQDAKAHIIWLTKALQNLGAQHAASQ